MTSVALFIGSHADDIELGAGGTVAKLCADGWSVWLIVLTSEADTTLAHTRREEARRAGQTLGVPERQILFADLPDTELVCNGKSVARVRDLASTHEVNPDVIFTHTDADSHKDHREARAIALASFRKKVVLGFAVVNSMVRAFSQYEGFRPSLFVDVSSHTSKKFESLRMHMSQRERIHSESVDRLMEEYGRRIATDRSEAFEMLVQEGASSDVMATVSALNHSPFHQVWSSILGDRSIALIHAESVWRRKRDASWKSDMDREGISLIQNSFVRAWDGRLPIETFSCEGDEIDEMLESRDILLSGGAVSNSITRKYFNHFSGVRYIIDYTMPGHRDIRVRDRVTNTAFRATYQYKEDGSSKRLVEDLGILTIMPNPFNRSRSLVGCMGVHGFGSLACFRYLSEPALLSELKSVIPLPLGAHGYQVLVRFGPNDERPHLDAQTVTRFDMEVEVP